MPYLLNLKKQQNLKFKQGCKIPLARSHLQVKCYAGQVKLLTICVVLFLFTASQRKIWDMRASNLFENFTSLLKSAANYRWHFMG